MRVIIQPDAETTGRRAARFVADLVRKKPACVLGLATGTSPLGLYRELVRLHREEGLDFFKVQGSKFKDQGSRLLPIRAIRL